jgi:hypothetical protein
MERQRRVAVGRGRVWAPRHGAGGGCTARAGSGELVGDDCCTRRSASRALAGGARPARRELERGARGGERRQRHSVGQPGPRRGRRAAPSLVQPALAAHRGGAGERRRRRPSCGCCWRWRVRARRCGPAGTGGSAAAPPHGRLAAPARRLLGAAGRRRRRRRRLCDRLRARGRARERPAGRGGDGGRRGRCGGDRATAEPLPPAGAAHLRVGGTQRQRAARAPGLPPHRRRRRAARRPHRVRGGGFLPLRPQQQLRRAGQLLAGPARRMCRAGAAGDGNDGELRGERGGGRALLRASRCLPRRVEREPAAAGHGGACCRPSSAAHHPPPRPARRRIIAWPFTSASGHILPGRCLPLRRRRRRLN